MTDQKNDHDSAIGWMRESKQTVPSRPVQARLWPDDISIALVNANSSSGSVTKPSVPNCRLKAFLRNKNGSMQSWEEREIWAGREWQRTVRDCCERWYKFLGCNPNGSLRFYITSLPRFPFLPLLCLSCATLCFDWRLRNCRHGRPPLPGGYGGGVFEEREGSFDFLL